ncbi:MAG: isoleucine--tRNA ligase [Bacteroidetes bacterium]|nr:isoleucine--tRNA ligase [Bacteroidota bacterium]
MQKYPEYKSLNLPEIDQQVLKFWEEEKIFEQSISSREGHPSFVFYEGPPSANGKPGIHHVISRTIKDLFCRYKSLKGFQVKRKGGWDTHGLPVELSVEKMLGIRKDDIGTKISIEEYNAICKQEVMKYKDVWEDLTRKMGYWVDLDHPYVTFENSYIESLWWLLKKFYDKGYLYEGYTIQPYSPAAGTGLSSHELNQPGTYKPLRDTSIVAQFKVIRDEKSEFLFQNVETDLCFLAWTTTPWTLPSNCALAVGEKITYSLIRTFNPYTFQPVTVLLAKELVGKYFPEKNVSLNLNDYKQGDKDIPFQIIGEAVGKDLEWLRYEQLMPYVQPDGKAFVVIVGDFVSTEEGTGIVHTASLFGADDFRVCRQKGIDSILVKDEKGRTSPLVDLQGRFVKEVTDFAGEYVKEQYYSDEEKEAERVKQGGSKYLSVDERIAIKLKKENKAFKTEKYEHPYPHCWRTDKPVLYYPLNSWFIKVTACKDRLVELNKTINWKPASTGEGRFGNWLENVQDWNLSRSRYWGTPLPIWRTDDGSEEICIGSIEELTAEFLKAKNAGLNANSKLEIKNTKLDIDLHKPFVDDIVLVSKTGKPMRRVPDLIDVWFDSGAMPYAQWHYPFENEEVFRENYPADYIAEGVDQTRGWFYTLHVVAGMLFDSVAYKNVIANGLVLDKFGNKMSKRLGNVVEPFEVMAKYGADATRWYLISNAQPWDNLKFDAAGIEEVRRKLFGTLYNTYSFFALYANIDGFEPDEKNIVPVSKRSEMDRWILSKLHSLVKAVDAYFTDYDPTPAARLIEEFVDRHLSNWYVRLSRRRFWKGEMNDDKKAAYETLFECLNAVVQLMSPVAPFFSDWMYRNLTGGIREQARKSNSPLHWTSVHLTSFAVAEIEVIDSDLEERMDLAQNISSLILSIRKKVNLKVRQPLQKVLVPSSGKHFEDQLNRVKDLILSEVNVKELQFLSDDAGFIKKKVKPNFKLLGSKLGKAMKAAHEKLSQLSQQEIQSLEKSGSISLNLEGNVVEISLTEVEVISEDVAGWQVASEGGVTVALDTTVTESLREEGNAREIVNQIQKLRKELDFNVTDRILVLIERKPELISSVQNFKEYICAEILADTFELTDNVIDGNSLEVNDTPVKIIIKRKKD